MKSVGWPPRLGKGQLEDQSAGVGLELVILGLLGAGLEEHLEDVAVPEGVIPLGAVRSGARCRSSWRRSRGPRHPRPGRRGPRPATSWSSTTAKWSITTASCQHWSSSLPSSTGGWAAHRQTASRVTMSVIDLLGRMNVAVFSGCGLSRLLPLAAPAAGAKHHEGSQAQDRTARGQCVAPGSWSMNLLANWRSRRSTAIGVRADRPRAERSQSARSSSRIVPRPDRRNSPGAMARTVEANPGASSGPGVRRHSGNPGAAAQTCPAGRVHLVSEKPGSAAQTCSTGCC